MFGRASNSCNDQLGKTIDDEGYTTFTIPLEGRNNAVDACGIQVTEQKYERAWFEANRQNFEFALGYENLFSFFLPYNKLNKTYFMSLF